MPCAGVPGELCWRVILDEMCKHQLQLDYTWLSGPKIVCSICGKRWDPRGKMLADVCCWLVDLLIMAVSPVFFGGALRAFAGYGQLSGLVGIVIFGLIVTPFVLVVHFSVFALGHAIHAWCIRRSQDLQRWIADDPYHQ